jgi:hypothetical protein
VSDETGIAMYAHPSAKEPPSELFSALVAFQAEVGTVAKDANNPFFKSTYADLPAVKAAAQPVLAKHSLGVIQEPSYRVLSEGKVVDTLITTVIHTSGQSRTSTMILRPVKTDPQAQGSAITYAKRYAFMAVLGLVADADDDGNAASGAAKPKAARAKAAAKPTAEEDATAAIRKAVEAVKGAVKAAGATPTEASAFYAENNDGASLISSTDLVALKATYDHYTGIANAKAGLGATEVTE